MLYRPLGRTGHVSSALVIGGAAYGEGTPELVDTHLQACLAAGCNTLDVAPSYGNAQDLLGQVLPPVRDRLFLSCKTAARDADGARRELEGSLSALRTDAFDLYQLHGITTDTELAQVLAPGGAVELLLQARAEGLVRHIGVTGHFADVPRLALALLDVVDLDTIMLPVSAAMLQLPEYRLHLAALTELVLERDLGVFAIKVFARRLWSGMPDRSTWYEPWEDVAHQQAALDLALSLSLPCVPVLPGDLDLSLQLLGLPETHVALTPEQVERAITQVGGEPLLRPEPPADA